MLGTPPAFILSQDQTLRLKSAASLPHLFDLGFRRLPRPFGGLGSPGGHLSIRFISQYPVFKVPASPSGGPRRLPSGRAAQGDTLPSRCHPVKDFFQELSFRVRPGGPGPRPPRKRSPNIIRSPPRPGKGVFRKIFGTGAPGGRFRRRGAGKKIPRPPLPGRPRGAGGAEGGIRGPRGGARQADAAASGLWRAAVAAGGAGQDPEGGFPTAPPKTRPRRRSGPRGSRRRR